MSYKALLFLLLSFSLEGQTGSLSGRVFDAGGKPVSMATVQLLGTEMAIVADADGNFQIKEIPAGEYEVKVRSAGFQAKTKKLRINAGENTRVNFTLDEDKLKLNDVVVSATRYELDRKESPVVVNVLSPKKLKAAQAMAISEGLNFQPGVRVETNCQNCGFTQVRLNGLEGSYTQILINP